MGEEHGEVGKGYSSMGFRLHCKGNCTDCTAVHGLQFPYLLVVCLKIEVSINIWVREVKFSLQIRSFRMFFPLHCTASIIKLNEQGRGSQEQMDQFVSYILEESIPMKKEVRFLKEATSISKHSKKDLFTAKTKQRVRFFSP